MDSKEHKMTVEQIRSALQYSQAAFQAAMDARDFQEARDQRTICDAMFELLVEEIQKEDPYTTEADIRYFEGIG